MPDTTPAPTPRDQLIADILRASWPDGGHDGFPSTKTAGMLADTLLDAGYVKHHVSASGETLPAVLAHELAIYEKGRTDGLTDAAKIARDIERRELQLAQVSRAALLRASTQYFVNGAKRAAEHIDAAAEGRLIGAPHELRHYTLPAPTQTGETR